MKNQIRIFSAFILTLFVVPALAAKVPVPKFNIVKVSPPPESFTEMPKEQQKDPIELAKVDDHHLDICNFNIQFLGNFKKRDNAGLADFLKKSHCDMVVVQELLAPPDLGKIPNGPISPTATIFAFPDDTPMKYNALNTKFFLQMQKAGYDRFWLSEEDTGNAATNKQNGSATEWFVVFYKNWLVAPKLTLPHGFLSDDRTHNPNWDRVPYAFSFETRDHRFDFVLISVHLHPDGGGADRARRKVEISSIFNWVSEQEKTNSERDFIVLGDMNIEDKVELDDVLAPGFTSLNTDAQYMTNTNIMNPKPYDQVMLNPQFTSEIQVENNFEVLNLLTGMEPYWLASHRTKTAEDYPGTEKNYQFKGVRVLGKFIVPSGHDAFRVIYSDHHPVHFRAVMPAQDDD